jgi:hypothetical protein
MTGFELRVYLAATPPALELTPLLHRPAHLHKQNCIYRNQPKNQSSLGSADLRLERY